MARAFQIGNYGVYVLPERGQPHHQPHAHIKHRGQRIASVYLWTLTVQEESEAVPRELMARIRAEHQKLLDLWARLNADD
jgi:hypothetical protein